MMRRLLPTVQFGSASGCMVTNDDDGHGRYLAIEWLGCMLLIEIMRRRG